METGRLMLAGGRAVALAGLPIEEHGAALVTESPLILLQPLDLRPGELGKVRQHKEVARLVVTIAGWTVTPIASKKKHGVALSTEEP